MKCNFTINIYTDGDFSLPFIPRGMFYDGDNEYADYTFEKSYKSRDKAVEDVLKICFFLKDNIHTRNDLVRERWNSCIEKFIEKVNKSSELLNGEVYERMTGNYDGTEFIFSVESESARFGFPVTDEEYEIILRNKNRVTSDMIKETILALYTNSTKE